MIEGARLGPPSRSSDAGLIHEVVLELQKISRQSGLQRTLLVGELVLSRFFGGDAATWRERRRNKNNSIRRLAARSDCPLKRSALNEAVAVFVAVSAMPFVRTFGHVGATHVAAVTILPADQRESILRIAEAERWSVRRLKHEVIVLRRTNGEKRGRPRTTSESKMLTALLSTLTRLERLIGELGAPRSVPLARPDLQSVADRFRALHAELESLGVTTQRIERGSSRAGADLAS